MINLWWLAIRPQTLLASIGPIVLATSLAKQAVVIDPTIFGCTLICAVLLQISVNLANDLFDGLSGVDDVDRLGPTRVVQSGLISPRAVKKALFITSSLAIASGLYLIFVGGWPIFIVGCLSLLGVFSYSAGPFPLASNALGEISVFVFFGLIAVLGCYYLQASSVSFEAIVLAVCVGIYSSAIMLVNNIRDIETDLKAGKRTLAVYLGQSKARYFLLGLVLSVLFIHLVASFFFGNYLWLATVICLYPSYRICRLGLTSIGAALNKLLTKVAQLGFLYALTVSVLLMV